MFLGSNPPNGFPCTLLVPDLHPRSEPGGFQRSTLHPDSRCHSDDAQPTGCGGDRRRPTRSVSVVWQPVRPPERCRCFRIPHWARTTLPAAGLERVTLPTELHFHSTSGDDSVDDNSDPSCRRVVSSSWCPATPWSPHDDYRSPHDDYRERTPHSGWSWTYALLRIPARRRW